MIMIKILIAILLSGHVSCKQGCVGAVVSKSSHGISRIIPGSPAEIWGLKKGDIILEADGVKGHSHLTGEPYQIINVKYSRDGVQYSVDMIRFGVDEVYCKQGKNYKIKIGD